MFTRFLNRLTMNRSFLFFFDFDETLTVRSSYLPVQELASNKKDLGLTEINFRYRNGHRCWNRRMNEVHERLAEQGITSKQVIETIRQLNLSPGTGELLQAIHQRQHRIIIVSGACNLFVEECLRAHNLLKFIDHIESNPVRQREPFIFVDEYEKPLQTNCQLCEPNQCKGLIVERYRSKHPDHSIVFVGDGDNDVCPALSLRHGDIALAKYLDKSDRPYEMYEQLKYKHAEKLRCDLFDWQTMHDVHRIMEEKFIL